MNYLNQKVPEVVVIEIKTNDENDENEDNYSEEPMKVIKEIKKVQKPIKCSTVAVSSTCGHKNCTDSCRWTKGSKTIKKPNTHIPKSKQIACRHKNCGETCNGLRLKLRIPLGLIMINFKNN